MSSIFKWFAARSRAKPVSSGIDVVDDDRICDNCKMFVPEGRYCKKLEVKNVKAVRALHCPYYSKKTIDGLSRPKAPKDWWYANEARHISAKSGIDPSYAKRIVGAKWWHVMKPDTVADKMGLWGSDEEIEHYREVGWPVPDYTDVEKQTEKERIRQEVLDNIKQLEHIPGSEQTIKDAMESYYKVWPQERLDPMKKRRKYSAPGLNEFSALDLMSDKFER
jgi:hypothetical protein